MKQAFSLTMLVITLLATFLIAGCPQSESHPVAKKCYEGKSGLRACLKVERLDDTMSKCSAPAESSKPKA